MNFFRNNLAAIVLLAGVCTGASFAGAGTPGGYATATVTDKEVRDAAAFAIEAQRAALKGRNEAEPVKLELVKILSAEQQVVAGMNYRLQLKVTLNGKEKTAEAIVWWQAWRKPAPYELTSWTWK